MKSPYLEMLQQAQSGLEMTACAAMCTCAHTPTSEGSVGMVTFDNQNVLFIKQVPPVFSCQREEMGGFYDLFLHLVWCLPHNKLPVVGS